MFFVTHVRACGIEVAESTVALQGKLFEGLRLDKNGGKMLDLDAHAADCNFFGEVIKEAY